jgi:hypothetical protein
MLRLLYLRERSDTHCIGDWMDSNAGLDMCGKSRPHRDLITECPARIESLYRLSYPYLLISAVQHVLSISILLLSVFKIVEWALPKNEEIRAELTL